MIWDGNLITQGPERQVTAILISYIPFDNDVIAGLTFMVFINSLYLTKKNGKLSAVIPKLYCHTALVLEY